MVLNMYKLKYKIWLDKNGIVLGLGPYALLTGVRQNGSLSKAAKELNMSYNKAHNLIKNVESRLGFELLISRSGGAGGGFSQLTKEAEELMTLYENFYSECEKSLNDIFDKYFGNIAQ